MTNQPPLNPDALRLAADAVSELYADGHCPKAEDAAEVAVSAYLAAALPEVTRSEDIRILIGDVQTAMDHEHLDPREFIDLNDVLWALKAQVQTEVTSVESIPAKMRMLMWEGGEFEVGEIPDGHVLVGFEMETDRSWSMADKVTINIERPEAKP